MRNWITLARRRTPYGTITIFENRQSGVLRYSQGDVYQSVTDRHGISLNVYIHAVYGLIVQRAARRLLVLGAAAGSLGLMLAATGRQVTLVDINPEAFLLAKRFFSLPAAVHCHVADGIEFLRNSPLRFGAVVVDVHDGAVLPAGFRRAAFLDSAVRHLAPGGVLLFNLIRDNDRDRSACRLACRLSRYGLGTQVLDTPGVRHRNVIVVAARKPLRRPSQLLVLPRIPASDLADLRTELHAMDFVDC